MFYIVISNKENFQKAAKLICNEVKLNGIEVNILELNDVKKIEDNNYNYLYFLTNETIKIKNCIKKFNKNHIINKDFLYNYKNKFTTYKEIEKLSPKKYNFNNFFKIKLKKFPIIIKNKKHYKNKNFKANNLNKINNILTKINKEEYFIEDFKKGEEIKVYIINNTYIKNEKIIYNKTLNKILKNLTSSINIECASIDIIIENKKHWIIDINPAPAFFKSKESRIIFCKYIKNKLK